MHDVNMKIYIDRDMDRDTNKKMKILIFDCFLTPKFMG
jgi:hypothetical protein